VLIWWGVGVFIFVLFGVRVCVVASVVYFCVRVGRGG